MSKGKLIGIVIGVVAFLLLGTYLAFYLNLFNKSVSTSKEITNLTMTGENAIYNYEWFKRQFHSIESLHMKISDAESIIEQFKSELPASRTEWDRLDKTEYDRLQTVLLGLNNQLNDSVAEYNARSEMVNRSIFKDELPSNITKAILNGLQLSK